MDVPIKYQRTPIKYPKTPEAGGRHIVGCGGAAAPPRKSGEVWGGQAGPRRCVFSYCQGSKSGLPAHESSHADHNTQSQLPCKLDTTLKDVTPAT